MKILMILGAGGHTAEMLEIYRPLKDDFDFEFIAMKDDNLAEKKVKGKIYRMRRMRRYGDSALKIAFNTFINIFESIIITLRSDAKMIISSGPGIAIPVFFFGKLVGKKTIFVETYSRTSTRAKTGFFCYYLSDMFFIQWPQLKKLYPKGIYAGRVA